MDIEGRFEPEFTTQTNPDEHGLNSNQQVAEVHSGAFFPTAKDFVVAGGNFKSVMNINQSPPSTPTDFRMIPLGDLDLRHEIQLKAGSAVVRRRHAACVRRVYTARIAGLPSPMTAAVFQGEGAEEQWRAEISQYSDLRHPNLVQLYGIANTRGLHVAVFHDDLIPWAEMREKYRSSHFSTVYLWQEQFRDVNEYYWSEYIVWIRPSTGQICIELMPPELDYLQLSPVESRVRPFDTSLFKVPENSQIIASISLQTYYHICYLLLAQAHVLPISTNVSVKLGSIRHFPSPEYEHSFEIAIAPSHVVNDRGWSTEDLNIDDQWNPWV
ncbi:hypothetical protein B0H19DRAFT_1268193 [Mycena capillaripes]|nr:hypothetical protein B0H19DRAFT_1268193 [Mycena capillaripes]